MNTEKYFIIDTNVLLHNPRAIHSFADNTVVIPFKVLEELDKFKRDRSEIGRNAREATRLLDRYRKKGSLSKGVKMFVGGRLLVSMDAVKDVPNGLSLHSPDDIILATALYYKNKDKQVFFVSKDINARIKADALGIRAVDYEKQKIRYSKIYRGYVRTMFKHRDLPDLLSTGSIDAPMPMLAHQYAVLQDSSDAEIVLLGRYNSATGRVDLLGNEIEPALGISPLNIEQRMAFDALMHPRIKLVSLIGLAGTGKTLLALSTGLHQVLTLNRYKRVLVARPIVPMGRDIGFLPGSKEDKLMHWMEPIFDNLEFIFSGQKAKGKAKEKIDRLIAQDLLEIEALTYIRGRSLPDQLIIIDEAQNLTPLEVKTIISRAGQDTKIILTGDAEQIDNPYLDEDSNGLSYVVDRLKESDLTGSVLLEKSERSPLASLAAEQL